MASTKESPFGGAAALVGTTTRVQPSELHTHPNNPRHGDVSLIAASLRTHGQYKPICVNVGTHTGRPNEVLAGNHTLMAFRDCAQGSTDPYWAQGILAHWVDVDEDTATRIMVVDNRASEVGSTDTETLVSLLTGLPELTGTGYTDETLADLVAIVERNADDLDALGDEYGEGTPVPGGNTVVVQLSLTAELSAKWTTYRAQYGSDSEAVATLLHAAGA